MKTIDIGSKAEFPGGALSNFSPFSFVFDGVECASMEGFLQSLKFDDPAIQIEVCQLVGKIAKKRGQERNEAWKQAQKLWWQGQGFDRHGKKFQELLDRAFAALAANPSFREALIATEDAMLIHSIGHKNPQETILTEAEFCSRLMQLREQIRAGKI